MGTAKTAEPSLGDVVRALLADDMDVAQVEALHGKRVLLRADLNVPINSSDGAISDASRIEAVLPTIRLLLAKGARVAVASHFGRPEPKKESVEAMKAHSSLAPVARYLQGALGAAFAGLSPDCIGADAEARVARLQPGEALLLENTRFHAGDTGNSDEFAAALARLADVFVNDAFGVVHRDQGSVTGVVRHVAAAAAAAGSQPPHHRVCFPGPLVRRELLFLSRNVLEAPVRPLAVVVGGAKVADKIGVLKSLIRSADVVMVGGKMALTFLAAQGRVFGAGQVEEAWVGAAGEMAAQAEAAGKRLLLPNDFLVSDSLDAPVNTYVLSFDTCCAPHSEGSRSCGRPGTFAVDIGPKTAARFSAALTGCNTVFWNGPMGKFEVPEFGAGTRAVADALAAATRRGCVTIVGGGDSVSAINQAGVSADVSHISTGGGASLELVEGKVLPGLRALTAL